MRWIEKHYGTAPTADERIIVTESDGTKHFLRISEITNDESTVVRGICEDGFEFDLNTVCSLSEGMGCTSIQ